MTKSPLSPVLLVLFLLSGMVTIYAEDGIPDNCPYPYDAATGTVSVPVQ